MKSAEQKARDLLERIGVENAQSFSAGDLVELANLIDNPDAERYRALRALALICGDLEAWVARNQIDNVPTPEQIDTLVDRLRA